MAKGRSNARKTFFCTCLTVLVTSAAIPEVAFPFNSQVPAVARVGHQYSFQFSKSSFAPDETNFTYSLSDQPAWLFLDSETRTLSGVPGQADAGASNFTLTAADSGGTAHMLCTLVISTDPPPQIVGDISEQLAELANLSSSQPPVLTILLSRPFHFEFRPNSFIDIVRRKLYYYATLTDHTPLPSWIQFDSQSLSFSGSAPQLSSFPQSWDIELIASDVEGFAGATTSFTIVIDTEQLVFVPEQQIFNITAGKAVNFTSIKSTLFLNGVQVDPTSLQSAQAAVPSWLSFNPSNLAITGIAPSSVTDQNITVTVKDKLGNQANASICLVASTSSLFLGTIGTLTAYDGQMFDYHFSDSLFAQPHLDLIVTLPTTAEWLHYDSNSRILSGRVPTQTSPSMIKATLTAKSPGMPEVQTQTFGIDIKARAPKTVVSSNINGHTTTSTTTSSAKPALAAGQSKSRSHLSGGVIAAIVLGSSAAVAFVGICLVLCWRRRNSKTYVEPIGSPRRVISRPIIPPDVDSITVTTEVHTDVEQTAEKLAQDGRVEDGQIAQLPLDLPSLKDSREFKWSKHLSRISLALSLGKGESAIRADSNVPELGHESNALQAPHHSFSVPTEIARSSRQLTELSSSKRALDRLRERRQSRSSIGLGIDTGSVVLNPRHSSKNARGHKREVSSLGLSAGTGRSRSSFASTSTRGTSVLSTRPSEFPYPPARSTFSGNKSLATLGLTEAEKHKSVRLVRRSESLADDRSMQEKRQSFIRNRASTTIDSPLFAHGSRTSVVTPLSGRRSANASSMDNLGRSRRERSHLTMHSEFSSSNAASHDPRRYSARLRSAFAPNYPRAIMKSTLGAGEDAAYRDSASDYSTTSESINEADLVADMALEAEMALPRHLRNFVLPGEASPTPPPAPPTSRDVSSASRRPSSSVEHLHKWEERLRERSSSPLSTALALPLADRALANHNTKTSHIQRSRLSEPMSLVSNDSLNRAKPKRPRLVQTRSKRPVSIERCQRFSSLKAETEDTRPGSEMWEAMQGAGLMPPNSGDGTGGTQNSNLSNLSGPAFL